MTFSEKLVKLRKIKGITQDEFASAVGVSRQAVYKWESGQSYPEATKLIEIKALFGISIDDLLDDSFEVIVPDKKKKRLSKAEKTKIEEKVDAEVTATAVEVEPKEEKTVVEAVVSAPAVATEVKEEAAPVVEEAVKVEEPAKTVTTEKKGFFSKLFGKK